MPAGRVGTRTVGVRVCVLCVGSVRIPWGVSMNFKNSPKSRTSKKSQKLQRNLKNFKETQGNFKNFNEPLNKIALKTYLGAS